jgi:hypothetical protein
MSALADRFAACKLPEKTKIVYCKDTKRACG